MSHQRLYAFLFDGRIKGQWHLTSPRDPSGAGVDCDILTSGKRLDVPGEITFRIGHPGHPVDVSFASVDTLVVAERVGSLIGRMASSPSRRAARPESRSLWPRRKGMSLTAGPESESRGRRPAASGWRTSAEEIERWHRPLDAHCERFLGRWPSAIGEIVQGDPPIILYPHLSSAERPWLTVGVG